MDDRASQRPDRFGQAMTLIYAGVLVVTAAYMVDVMSDGAVHRRAGLWWARVGVRLREQDRLRRDTAAVVWAATEATMDAAETGTDQP